jgi:uncharacterized protein
MAKLGDNASDDDDGERVAEYLRRHPDFLARHPKILDGLTPPAQYSGDGVVDMQQFMLERLRGEVDNLRSCAVELIDTSRSNMSSQTRIHAAALAILGTDDFEELLRALGDDLPLLLDMDAVIIGFEPAAAPVPDFALADVRRLSEGTVDRLLGDSRDVVLLRETTDDGTVFGAAAGLVRSAAMARIRPGRRLPVGLLAFGARGPGSFHPGLGTDLVEFLARVVERCIHKWLDGSD